MSRTRTTRTYALLEVPLEAYRMIRERLTQAAGKDADVYLDVHGGGEIMNFGAVALIADNPESAPTSSQVTS